MIHPLVRQLRFARSEFRRCLEGLSEADAQTRLGPMNSIGWMIGHLANQENFYWCMLAQGENDAPGLNERVGTGKPASTPSLAEMWTIWEQVTAAADRYLDTLSSDMLTTHFEFNGRRLPESVGTQILRTLYHYWFHIGEAHAVRQQLGHGGLPQFVGDMTTAVYTPEA